MLSAGMQSMALRGGTSLARFALFAVVARYLPVAEVGRFGLLLASLALTVQLVGLEFYTFNTRELIARPEEQARLLRDQAVLHGATYVVVFPLLLLLFVGGALPWVLALWFYGLLLFEHVCQELVRALIALSRPVLATFINFVRNGAWVAVAIPVLVFSPESRTLETVLVLWLSGAATAALIGLLALRGLPDADSTDRESRRHWLERGLRTAAPFLLSSLAIRGMAAIDRYLLDAHFGEAAVGVYAFFYGVCNFVPVMVDAGVTRIVMPRLVRARQQDDKREVKRSVRALTVATVVICLGLVGAIAIGIWPVLDFVGRSAYRDGIGVFWILLGATAASALAAIPHTMLYAAKRDRMILAASVVGFAVAAVANVVLIPTYAGEGAAMATAAGFGAILLVKAAGVRLGSRER